MKLVAQYAEISLVFGWTGLSGLLNTTLTRTSVTVLQLVLGEVSTSEP